MNFMNERFQSTTCSYREILYYYADNKIRNRARAYFVRGLCLGSDSYGLCRRSDSPFDLIIVFITRVG